MTKNPTQDETEIVEIKGKGLVRFKQNKVVKKSAYRSGLATGFVVPRALRTDMVLCKPVRSCVKRRRRALANKIPHDMIN